MIGIELGDDDAAQLRYTEVTREKLRALWMNRAFAGPSEKLEAEESFERFMSRLDGPNLPDVSAAPEELKDQLVAVILRIAELRTQGEDAGNAMRQAHEESGNLFEMLFALAEALGVSELLKRPEKKSLSQQIMEYILEVDLAVNELVPVRLAAYRNTLAAHGLGEAPDVPGEEKSDDMGEGVRTGVRMAGMNLADQAALRYHDMLLDLAAKVASAKIESGSDLDLDGEWNQDAVQP